MDNGKILRRRSLDRVLTSVVVIISGLGALDGTVAMVGGSSVPLGIWLWVFSCSAVRFVFLVSGGITPARQKLLLTVAAAAAIPCGWIASMQPDGHHRDPLSQCINNMGQVERAKAAWAFGNKKPNGTAVEWSDMTLGPANDYRLRVLPHSHPPIFLPSCFFDLNAPNP